MKKMAGKRGFKYPKFALFLVCVVFAYWLFSYSEFIGIEKVVVKLGLFGMFLAGMMFTYGFTTPIAIAIFLMSSPENIFIASLVAGVGALIGDMTIFSLVRYSFRDEVKLLSKEKIVLEIEETIPKKIRKYLAILFAGFIIASPLPDEVGVSMLAGVTKISTKVFMVVSFVMNTLGILVMLWIGQRI